MFTFYNNILLRQLRQSSMRLFCIAVAIACAVTFSITLLGDRLEQLFNSQAKEVIAADLVLQSTTDLSEAQKALIEPYSLNKAETLTFQTMANAGGTADKQNSVDERFLLSSAKAVSNAYPLLGKLQVSNQLYGEVHAIEGVPQQGEAWVEDRVLNELGPVSYTHLTLPTILLV